MKVIVHYPDSQAKNDQLKQKVAQIHADAVCKFISNLNCNSEEKIKLIEDIKNAGRRQN